MLFSTWILVGVDGYDTPLLPTAFVSSLGRCAYEVVDSIHGWLWNLKSSFIHVHVDRLCAHG